MLRIQGCVSKKPAFAQEAVFPLTKKTLISQGFHMERVMEIEPAAMQRVAAGRPIFYRLNELA
jgi:hypothetical protein